MYRIIDVTIFQFNHAVQILASILGNYIVAMHRYFHKLFGSFVNTFHRFATFQYIEFKFKHAELAKFFVFFRFPMITSNRERTLR